MMETNDCKIFMTLIELIKIWLEAKFAKIFKKFNEDINDIKYKDAIDWLNKDLVSETNNYDLSVSFIEILKLNLYFIDDNLCFHIVL